MLSNAYYNSNRARFLVQQEMNKNISAAQILGVNKSSLQTEFKDRQISDKTVFNNLAKVSLNHTFHQKIYKQDLLRLQET